MKEGIDIEINLKDSTISDLHKTITSLLRQTGLANFPHNIYLLNISSPLDCQNELQRLTNQGMKYSTSAHNYKYFISLQSGNVISDAYIYKAIHFLKNNLAAFVCPEYSFQRITNTSTIVTTINNNRLFGQVASMVIDKEKILQNNSKPYTTTIQNTCTLTKICQDNFYSYIKTVKRQEAFLAGMPYRPSHLVNINNTSAKSKSLSALKTNFLNDAKTILGKSKIVRGIVSQRHGQRANYAYISPAMRSELNQLSEINYDYKGFMSMKFIDVKNILDMKNTALFKVYNNLCHHLSHDQYDYIMVLPWIIAGGVDLFAINYINTIAELNPKQNILIIITNNTRASIKKDDLTLKNNIEILNIPSIITDKETYQQNILPAVHSLISNLSPRTLHIMASKVGYDCLIKYNDSIRQSGLRIIFSSYNYLINERGEYFGYTVQELPMAYRPHDIVTTDNTKSKQLWIEKYGFLPDDILVHDQLFTADNIPSVYPTSKDGLNILWAAHVRPEKNPEILLPIAEALKNDNIQIDCYGTFNSDDWEQGNNPLITNLTNLHYCGPYNNFFTDIDLSKYDLFLYTSHADGTPNVILEAGLSGIPIVSSSIGGIPDAIGNYATLVQDSNSVEGFLHAIRQALADHEHTIAQAQALQEQLRKKHSKTHFIKQVQEMLERNDYA